MKKRIQKYLTMTTISVFTFSTIFLKTSHLLAAGNTSLSSMLDLISNGSPTKIKVSDITFQDPDNCTKTPDPNETDPLKMCLTKKQCSKDGINKTWPCLLHYGDGNLAKQLFCDCRNKFITVPPPNPGAPDESCDIIENGVEKGQCSNVGAYCAKNGKVGACKNVMVGNNLKCKCVPTK